MIAKANNSHCQYLSPGTQRIVDGNSHIYYSELKQYFSNDAFRSFSIKLPLEGTVHYKTNSRSFDVSPGQFLLISKQPGQVYFDTATEVKSICIDISEKNIAEAFTVLQQNENDLDNLQAGWFCSPDFFENIYTLENDVLGVTLAAVAGSVKQKETADINEALFFTLAEKVILHQKKNQAAISGLGCTKLSTRKEILQRLLSGKHFIDENYLSNPSIACIAMHANLSEFHFFRSFKTAFGVSPYQYMLDKRLRHAATLLQTEMPVKDIALVCGFPDLFTFSKAFKRKYGFAPTVYAKMGQGLL